MFHSEGVFLELRGQLSHLLGAGKKALTLGYVANLFLGGTLRHFSDLVNLLLRFCYRVLLDASVIVLVNTSEIGSKFLIKDVRSQVLLALNELQIV